MLQPYPSLQSTGVPGVYSQQVKRSLEVPGGEAQGLTGRRWSVPPSPKNHLFGFFFFFFWETLIVVECSTAYSKYHSYKLLASTFQSDHYLIFKTKQNPKESKTTKPDLHFIHTSVATGLSKLYAPGCVLKTPINYLIKLLGRHRSKVYYYNYYFSMFLFVFKM